VEERERYERADGIFLAEVFVEQLAHSSRFRTLRLLLFLPLSPQILF